MRTPLGVQILSFAPFWPWLKWVLLMRMKYLGNWHMSPWLWHMSSLGILCLFFIQNARIQTNLKINEFSVNDNVFEKSKIAGKVKNKIGKDTDMSKSVNQGQNQVLNQRKRSGEDLDLQLNKAVQKGKLISVELILKSNWMKR